MHDLIVMLPDGPQFNVSLKKPLIVSSEKQITYIDGFGQNVVILTHSTFGIEG